MNSSNQQTHIGPLLHCINTHTVWHDNKQLKKQRHYYLPSCHPEDNVLDGDMSQRLEYVLYCIKINTIERIELQRCGWVEMNGADCGWMNHEVHFRLP